MKKGFLITNGLALFFAIVSIGWLIYDFIAYGILFPKIRRLEPLTATDVNLDRFIDYGLLIFLLFPIISFIAIASQFRYFRKASALRVIALILGMFSCLLLFADIAGLSDVFNEYEKGNVAGEWKLLYVVAALRALCFLAIIGCLIEAFKQYRKIRTEDKVLKDEVLFTLVHCVGVFCGLAGLFFSNVAFIFRLAHPLLYYTFPIIFALTLIPYGLLAAYWLITLLNEKSGDLYDEKQFQDISKAGLLSTLITVPFLAMIYVVNYNVPRGPIEILWFPFYLYFVILIFSLTSLYFSWRD
jgi:hypothetical protein